MPGYEVFGEDERRAINELFDLNGGIVFAHGFDSLRNGIFRVREYERVFAEQFGFNYAQALSSGTAAIRVSLEAAGVVAGDEVITQSHTYIATVEAIMSLGAIPVIVDINDSLNMDPTCFESAISNRTKAVIPVHMLGEMANMEEISRIASKYGITIIEDCAQALGAKLGDKPAGSFSLIAGYSTDAGKTINTGEGGMVLTNSEDIYIKARALHDHGHTYDPSVPRGLDPAIGSGFNFRMTELQGAIGIAQFSKFDYIIDTQRKNKQKLMNNLSGLPIKFRTNYDPMGDAGDTLVMLAEAKSSATEIVANLKTLGVGTKNLPDAMKWHFSKHWSQLVGRNEAFDSGFAGGWKTSAELLERSIAIGISLKWVDSDIDRISESIHSAWI